MGEVYSLCKFKNCDYVLKVEKNSTGEERLKIEENRDGVLGKEAGEIGVAPKVHNYGVCTNENGSDVYWTLMDRIYGKTLSEKYPLNLKRLKNIH